MSVGFPNLSWWLWSAKKRNAKLTKGSQFNGMDLDLLKFPGASDSRRTRRGEEEEKGKGKGKVDKELDVVLVPSDGGSSSESESESVSSDWSIGWSEPHASGFLSEDEMDGGFGVLVRCYGTSSVGKQDVGKGKDLVESNGNVPKLYATDSKKYMEQWLSSLQQS